MNGDTDKMKKDGLVSVIIPVYKAEKFIDDTLKSILNQTYKNIEIIVVYNPSPDDTWKRLKKYEKNPKIKIIKNTKRANCSKSRNIGMKSSNGEFIALCDADDMFDPKKIEKQVEYLRKNVNIGLTYTNTVRVDEKGNEIERIKSPAWNKKRWISSPFITISSVVVRRKYAFEFNEEFAMAGDYDWLIRLSNKTEFGRIKEFLVYYRIHEQQMSSKLSDNIDALRVLWGYGYILPFLKRLTLTPYRVFKIINKRLLFEKTKRIRYFFLKVFGWC